MTVKYVKIYSIVTGVCLHFSSLSLASGFDGSNKKSPGALYHSRALVDGYFRRTNIKSYLPVEIAFAVVNYFTSTSPQAIFSYHQKTGAFNDHDVDNKTYSGHEEDYAWFKVIRDLSKILGPDDFAYLYHHLMQKNGIFRMNARKYLEKRRVSAQDRKYKNFKGDVLNGPYRISIHDWKRTVFKSKKFCKSWTGQCIRSLKKGTYRDTQSQDIDHDSWNRGDKLEPKDLVPVKLFTDFDELRSDFKKVFNVIEEELDYRLELADDQLSDPDRKERDAQRNHISLLLQEYTDHYQRYFNFRTAFLKSIQKYSRPAPVFSSFYYNSSRKPVLGHSAGQEFVISEPLDVVTNAYDAQSYLTESGSIIELVPRYSRSNRDDDISSTFHGHEVSDYPEEHLHILNQLVPTIGGYFVQNNSIKIPRLDFTKSLALSGPELMSIARHAFLANHLFFVNKVFNLSTCLEEFVNLYLDSQINLGLIISHWFHTGELDECIPDDLLKLINTFYGSRADFTDQNGNFKNIFHPQADLINPDLKTLKSVMISSLESIRNTGKLVDQKYNHIVAGPEDSDDILEIETIEPGFKERFLKKEPYKNIYTGQDVDLVSFIKINKLFPYAKKIHFLNKHRLDNIVLKRLIEFIRSGVGNLEEVAFRYYNFMGKEGVPDDSEFFYHPDHLSTDLLKNELAYLGWSVKHGKTAKGFEIYLGAGKTE